MATSMPSNETATSTTAMFPPRPDAIVTLLTTDDFLPGAQTILYSVKKHLADTDAYPPELVVLVTPNVPTETRHALTPFCTRVLEVEPLDFPDNKKVSSHVESWIAQGALTKLHIFSLENYGKIIYVDADCLVVKDISHLLNLNSESALVAAAPDIMPPDKFNAGVLVISPSVKVFEDIKEKSSTLDTYDGGDTGFLNAYFDDWYTMPSSTHLAFGYNAQRFLYHCTHAKQPNYWDMAVAPNLYIIHYSSSPKPWETKMPAALQQAQEHLGEQVDLSSGGELETLWSKWYNKSQKYAEKYFRQAAQEEAERQEAAQRAAEKAAEPPTPAEKKEADLQTAKMVKKRYNQLRKEGKSTQEAMEIARKEFGQDQQDHISPGQQVAQMFGMM